MVTASRDLERGLEQAGVPAEVAQQIGQAFEERFADVADKEDVRNLREDTRRDIANLREDFGHLREDVVREITTFREDVRQDISTFRGDVRHDIANLREDVRREIDNLRQDIDSRLHQANQITWRIFAVQSGLIAALLGAVIYALVR